MCSGDYLTLYGYRYEGGKIGNIHDLAMIIFQTHLAPIANSILNSARV